jgi:menaquinone-9 beta-reductase
VRVAVVGAGPAGSLLAWKLAEDGAAVRLFDPSHPREKPCGGGLTAKALELLPRKDFPARWVTSCRFTSGNAPAVEVCLPSPIAVASRRELDGWLLELAVRAGVSHVSERVTRVEKGGRVSTSAGREERFDVVVGADGAGSLVRRSMLAPAPPARLSMALGYYVPGEAPMEVRFLEGLAGYLWVFPRLDHLSVGICAPLGAVPSRALLERLAVELESRFPRLAREPRYAHTVPSPSTDPASILEIAGPGWALVGDAAALADPITGEGIAHALHSAVILAETLRETASTSTYPERVLGTFGRDLLKAAGLRERFFSPGFTDRMLRYSARSGAIREVLTDLVLGHQGYLGLKRRLVRAVPRFAWESLTSAI